MVAPTRLCNFVQNILTNISALGQRTHLKLGDLSSLFIIYNITILFIRFIVFDFVFYCVTVHTLYRYCFTILSELINLPIILYINC